MGPAAELVSHPLVVGCAVAGGGSMAWSVPALARRFPSRVAIDRVHLAVWSRTQRAVLAAVGTIVLMSGAVAAGSPVGWLTTAALTPFLLTAAAVDVRTQRIPDRLLIAAATVGVGGLALAMSVDGVTVAGSVAAGMATLAGVLGVAHLIRPHSLGLGDVKLGALGGGWIGLVSSHPAGAVRLACWAVVVACAATLVAAMLLAMVRKRAWAAPTPFGPGLIAASWLVVVGAG